MSNATVSRIKREFDRFAAEYPDHQAIQAKVAQTLVAGVSGQPRRILDLGCGSGLIWQQLTWPCERFVALDDASQMLARHPDAPAIVKVQADFDHLDTAWPYAIDRDFDLAISSSALHWAVDLPAVLRWLHNLSVPQIALALFTSGTFASLHRLAGIDSPLRSRAAVTTALYRQFGVIPVCRHYRLHFQDIRAILRYIKRSGISGGRNILTISQTRRLLAAYPYRYLEFEVVFLWWPRGLAPPPSSYSATIN